MSLAGLIRRRHRHIQFIRLQVTTEVFSQILTSVIINGELNKEHGVVVSKFQRKGGVFRLTTHGSIIANMDSLEIRINIEKRKNKELFEQKTVIITPKAPQ